MSLKSCIICNQNNNKQLYEGIVKCSNCKHVFANLELSDLDYKALYTKDYFHGNEYSDYVSDKKILQKNFLDRLLILKKMKYYKFNSRLLEIGSAYGFFLEIAKNYFSHVEGIDITKEGINYAKQNLNLKVKNIDFLKWDTKNYKWDIICLWDTIEHLERPDLFIKKANKSLNKNGLITITTGDISSWLARFRGRKWRLIHPPTHVHYFSKKTLTLLLANEGFEVIYFGYPGFYRSFDNIFYNIFVLRLKQDWIYNLIKFFKFDKLSIYFNTFDISYVIAKKRS